jgi:ribosome-associated translation inhibitor RaiA
MIIDTRAIGFSLTDAIQRHVEFKVESGLGSSARWILGITARLDDVNANRGGVDKRCRLVINIRGYGVLTVEATHTDLYAAVDEAVVRARRSVMRIVKRHVTLQRKHWQHHGALAAV